MKKLGIKDTAVLIGFNPKGECVYSAAMSLGKYWDGEHIWDTDAGIKGSQLRRVKGFLFDESGELLQEFESVFNLDTGIYESGWARHADGTLREDTT